MQRVQLRSNVVIAVVLSAAVGFFIAPPGSTAVAALVGLAIGVLMGGALAWQLPRQRIRQAQERGTLDAHRVQIVADEEGFEVTSAGWRSRVVWSAVERIAPRRQHIFVHLSDVQAFVVPRRAIGDRAAQAAFVAQLRTWRIGGHEPALPSIPDPGRDAHILRYRLVHDDYVMFARIVHADALRRRPLGLALMGVLTGGVLLASAEPWRTGVDVGLIALMIVFSGGLVLLGLAPLWYPRLFTPWVVRRSLRRSPGRMPAGPVVLGVGPEGGWLQSTRGVSRFSWRELVRIHSDADLVLLLFSDLVGVVVPARAFDPPEEQDAFVTDIERWQAAPTPDPAEAREHARPARRRDGSALTNPFYSGEDPPKT